MEETNNENRRKRVRRIGQWSQKDLRKLISLFKEHPFLWDVSLQEYRDRAKRANQITKIAQILNKKRTEVEAQWNNLRGQYRRNLRKISRFKSGQGQGEVCVIFPFFQDMMSFLNVNYRSWNSGLKCESGRSSPVDSNEPISISHSTTTSVSQQCVELETVTEQKTKSEKTVAELSTKKENLKRITPKTLTQENLTNKSSLEPDTETNPKKRKIIVSENFSESNVDSEIETSDSKVKSDKELNIEHIKKLEQQLKDAKEEIYELKDIIADIQIKDTKIQPIEIEYSNSIFEEDSVEIQSPTSYSNVSVNQEKKIITNPYRVMGTSMDRSNTSNTPDAFDLFGAMVASSLRELDQKISIVRQELQINIQEVILNAQKKLFQHELHLQMSKQDKI